MNVMKKISLVISHSSLWATGIIDSILTTFRKRDYGNKKPFYNVQYRKVL